MSYRVDLHALAEASRSLSSETELDRLLAKMMELVMSYSGADRAVLLWEEGVDWFVQALSDIASGEQEILLNRPFDPTDRGTDLLSRTRLSLLPEDQRADGCGGCPVGSSVCRRPGRPSSSRSIDGVHPRLEWGELRGLLYLENSEMADVFTLERVEILNYVVSQFAVSVENAKLYESLNRKVRELQASDERYELAVAGSLAGLWDWDIPSNELHTSGRLNELLGYAPGEISFFFEKILSEGNDVEIPEYLSDHPDSDARVRDVRRTAEESGCGIDLGDQARWREFQASLPAPE